MLAAPVWCGAVRLLGRAQHHARRQGRAYCLGARLHRSLLLSNSGLMVRLSDKGTNTLGSKVVNRFATYSETLLQLLDSEGQLRLSFDGIITLGG